MKVFWLSCPWNLSHTSVGFGLGQMIIASYHTAELFCSTYTIVYGRVFGVNTWESIILHSVIWYAANNSLFFTISPSVVIYLGC